MNRTAQTNLKRIDFDNAEDFFAAISPSGEFFGKEDNPSPWIFRGQAKVNETWKLVPSALRDDKQPLIRQFALKSGVSPDHLGSNIAQAIAELSILCDLATELDRQGLLVPPSSAHVFSTLRQMQDSYRKKPGHDKPITWPAIDFKDLMSLAQHYDLPTRLLDWTRCSYSAAYFAVDTARECDPSGRASVWALNAMGLDDGFTFLGDVPNLRLVLCHS